MTITNGYSNAYEFTRFAAPEAEENADDDVVIEAIIEAASRYIDAACRRRFYATNATRYYDAPSGRDLWLDDDLLTVTTLTNGDGTVIPAASYKLQPYNAAPYYAIRLTASSGISWSADSSGDTEGVISVAGTWGYCATAPADIKEACLLITRNIYRSRTGETTGAATVTGAGVVITPKDIPDAAKAIIARYTRLVL